MPQYGVTIFEDGDFTSEDNGVIDLMFAGNIGKAQSVDTIIKAAALLKDDTRFKFHIVGSGSELDNVKTLAAELKTDNVIFYGQRPLEDMSELYRIADAMLVTLEDKPYANMTIPGKVQSYMAAGKPIVGAINGSCANLITDNKIGFVCTSSDYVRLATTIRLLSVSELHKQGELAKQIYNLGFSKEIFFKKLEFELKQNIREQEH